MSHVLEGSARRSGDRIHWNAQLIDTRTDTHVWAEDYDRDLNDLFVVQSEIAQKVAERLNAKITAAEKVAIERKSTTDLAANALYVQAREFESNEGGPEICWKPCACWRKRLRAIRISCSLIATSASSICRSSFGTITLRRREMANAAIQNAVRLQPDAGEVHRALAMYAYWGFFDYDRARAELELAQRTLPNDPEIYSITGMIDRRQGRWTDAIRNFERAVDWDPRNNLWLFDAARTYSCLRRYSASSALWERCRALAPRKWTPPVELARQPFLSGPIFALCARSFPRWWRSTRRQGRNLLTICSVAQSLEARFRCRKSRPGFHTGRGDFQRTDGVNVPARILRGRCCWLEFNDTAAADAAFSAAHTIARINVP